MRVCVCLLRMHVRWTQLSRSPIGREATISFLDSAVSCHISSHSSTTIDRYDRDSTKLQSSARRCVKQRLTIKWIPFHDGTSALPSIEVQKAQEKTGTWKFNVGDPSRVLVLDRATKESADREWMRRGSAVNDISNAFHRDIDTRMNTVNACLFAGRRHVRDEYRGSGKLSRESTPISRTHLFRLLRAIHGNVPHAWKKYRNSRTQYFALSCFPFERILNLLPCSYYYDIDFMHCYTGAFYRVILPFASRHFMEIIKQLPEGINIAKRNLFSFSAISRCIYPGQNFHGKKVMCINGGTCAPLCFNGYAIAQLNLRSDFSEPSWYAR